MQSLLDGAEFRDPARPPVAALRLSTGLPERSASRIQVLLASVPDPDTAVRFLERLRAESPSAFDRITRSPGALRSARHLFSFSAFLAEAVLKHPERIVQVANSGSLDHVLTAEEYEERLFDF